MRGGGGEVCGGVGCRVRGEREARRVVVPAVEGGVRFCGGEEGEEEEEGEVVVVVLGQGGGVAWL